MITTSHDKNAAKDEVRTDNQTDGAQEQSAAETQNESHRQFNIKFPAFAEQIGVIQRVAATIGNYVEALFEWSLDNLRVVGAKRIAAAIILTIMILSTGLWLVSSPFGPTQLAAQPSLEPLQRAASSSPISGSSATSDKDVSMVHSWLESQWRGRTGEEFWSAENNVQPARFLALRSWEVVDDYVEDGGRNFTVRADSSDPSGAQITKLWTVTVRGFYADSSAEEYDPRITKVEETIKVPGFSTNEQAFKLDDVD